MMRYLFVIYLSVAYLMMGAGLLTAQTAIATQVVATTTDFAVGFDDVFAQCRQHFYDGKSPTLIGSRGERLNKELDALCFEGFAVLHSGVSRTPLWSAEYLTRERIEQARTLVRNDSFRAESRLAHSRRAELSDYSHSGFDRGHLSPNGDMANTHTQYESFSLANIVPQNGTHNRNVWRHIETATRNLTIKYGDVYVVNGVVFDGKTIARIGGRVMVPSHLFKAVYIPSLNQAGVYYSPNIESASYEIISLNELQSRTGMSVFPMLPTPVQNQAYQLSESNNDGKQMGGKAEVERDKINLSSMSGWLLFILEILKYFITVINR